MHQYIVCVCLLLSACEVITDSSSNTSPTTVWLTTTYHTTTFLCPLAARNTAAPYTDWIGAWYRAAEPSSAAELHNPLVVIQILSVSEGPALLTGYQMHACMQAGSSRPYRAAPHSVIGMLACRLVTHSLGPSCPVPLQAPDWYQSCGRHTGVATTGVHARHSRCCH